MFDLDFAEFLTHIKSWLGQWKFFNVPKHGWPQRSTILIFGTSFFLGSMTTALATFHFAKKISKLSTIQLIVKILSLSNASEFNTKYGTPQDEKAISFWQQNFPKAKQRPTPQLLSIVKQFKNLEFGSFEKFNKDPKISNPYKAMVDEIRTFSKNMIEYDLLDKPHCVSIPPKQHNVSKYCNLHEICYPGCDSDSENNSNSNRNTGNNGIIISIHGGSFVGGSYHSELPLLCEIGRQCSLVGYSLEYRLCPENGITLRDSIKDIHDSYNYIKNILKIDENKIYMVGSSSGATILLLFLQDLLKMNSKQPKCAVLISPCCDLSYSLPSIKENQNYDCMEGFAPQPNPCCQMGVGNIDINGKRINNVDLKDEKFSPLYGKWAGLCPLYFSASQHEILFDDSRFSVDKAQKAGVDVQFDWDPALPHCGPLLFDACHEGRDALARICTWINSHRVVSN